MSGTAAATPGVFGVAPARANSLYVTSNAGFTGGSGPRGDNSVKHVVPLSIPNPFGAVTTIATGLGYPEGLDVFGGDLSIAAGSGLYTVPTGGGTPTLYAGAPIQYSHGVRAWAGAIHVTDSHGTGEVHKVT